MIKTIIFTVLLGAISCGSNVQFDQNATQVAPSGAVSEKTSESEAISVVEEFLALIAADEPDKARKLFKYVPTPRESKSPTDSGAGGEDRPTSFDWTGYFHERGFRLMKVLSARSKGDEASVHAALGLKDSRNDITQETVFSLIKQDGKWFISNVDFVFDRSKAKPQ